MGLMREWWKTHKLRINTWTFKSTGLVRKFWCIVHENIQFQQKKIMLWKKWHFVENKTQIMQHILKMQLISLLSKYIKGISRAVYIKGISRTVVSSAFTYANTNHLRLNLVFSLTLIISIAKVQSSLSFPFIYALTKTHLWISDCILCFCPLTTISIKFPHHNGNLLPRIPTKIQ